MLKEIEKKGFAAMWLLLLISSYPWDFLTPIFCLVIENSWLSRKL